MLNLVVVTFGHVGATIQAFPHILEQQYVYVGATVVLWEQQY